MPSDQMDADKDDGVLKRTRRRMGLAETVTC
jgi:hypothetical protein